MSDDLDDKVADWIETSGRALELRTARLFQRYPQVRFVSQSMAYEDPETKQQREGDVCAAYHWVGEDAVVSLEVAAECKSGKDHPWVAFMDSRQSPSSTNLADWAVMSPTWPDDAASEVESAMEWEGWMSSGRIASHVASALGNDRHNTAHDAARQALSFARARAMSPIRVEGDPQVRPVAAAFPVVVTQAPLYTCELGREGETLLERVEEFDVRVHVNRTTRYRVYVKTEAAMERMAEQLSQVRNRFRA